VAWALGIVLVLAVLFGFWLQRWWYWRGRAKKRQAGLVAEEQAAKLLKKAGYRVLESQVVGEVELELNGERCVCEIRLDYVVEREGEEWLVEVKSGSRAPDPTSPTTRRQLLEYCLAFETDRILLVDMEEREIHEVVFPMLTPPSQKWWWPFGNAG
jgi:Holliday junction resolvase-like predicted endonuclease